MLPMPPMSLPVPADAFEGTRPRRKVSWMLAAAVGGVAAIIGVFVTPVEGAEGIDAADRWALAWFIAAGVGIAGLGWSMWTRHRLGQEAGAVQAVEEGQRLQRYGEAEAILAGVLAGPMLHPINRLRALASYVTALVVRGRLEESIEAADALMGEGVPFALMAQLRASKAYALIREDRLSDADRALGDVRKMGRDGPIGAVLGVLEQYRDLRTGHGEDLLAAHAGRVALAAAHVSRRVADLEGMAALAARRLGKGAEVVAGHWAKATLIAPAGELAFRYPELAGMSDVAGTAWPAGLAWGEVA